MITFINIVTQKFVQLTSGCSTKQLEKRLATNHGRPRSQFQLMPVNLRHVSTHKPSLHSHFNWEFTVAAHFKLSLPHIKASEFITDLYRIISLRKIEWGLRTPCRIELVHMYRVALISRTSSRSDVFCLLTDSMHSSKICR